MSSLNWPTNRKRNHSSPFRDDSDGEDDDPPPSKLKRRNIGSKVPNTISTRLKNLFIWISDLPVTDYFKMAVKAGTELSEDITVIDDDDDDEKDGVVNVSVKEARQPEKRDDQIEKRVNPFVERFKESRKLMIAKNLHPSSNFENCLSNSRGRSLTNGISYLGSSKPIDGSGSKTLSFRSNENGSYKLRDYRNSNLKRPAIISNPDTDIEILLEMDSKQTLSAEADEIEILSESPNMKKKISAAHQQLSASPRCVAKKSISSQGISQSHKAGTYKSQSQSSANGTFTCNEVFRLREKVQYQLLLDKYISGSSRYHSLPIQSYTDVEIEIDSDDLDVPGSHFKKEILQQPVENFIQKYCKPCQLVSPITYRSALDRRNDSPEKKEPVEVQIIDDDDDDVQILEVKLPEYKPKYRQTPDFFSSNWISELKRTVNAQSEERMIIVQEQEQMIERFRKERLLELLKIDVPESKEPEFPALTEEMEEEIDRALTTGAPDDRMCKITSDYLLRKDIETLSGLSWLNDLVINSYFDLIVLRSKNEGYPSIHACNTFFYSTYKTKGYASVRRWTRKIDIFSFDLNFVPIHLAVHWCLAVIDHRSKKICYYDSMGRGEEQCLNLLHEYLILEHLDKKGLELDPTAYTTEVMKDIPQQMNGSDCGMFTLKYAEYISRDAEITFSQKHMQYFRRRMVYEILNCKLL